MMFRRSKLDLLKLLAQDPPHAINFIHSLGCEPCGVFFLILFLHLDASMSKLQPCR